MPRPQPGIFALGTMSHAYLEFDRLPGTEPDALVAATEPRTTMGGVNLVSGFRPTVWSAIAGSSAPPAADFAAPVVAAFGNGPRA